MKRGMFVLLIGSLFLVVGMGGVFALDEDGDGFHSIATGGDDCEDWNASINPNAAEIIDNVYDDDCDGWINRTGWTIPWDTPLGRRMHPRILFIPDQYRAEHPDAVGYTVQEMRDKLITYYSSEFQTFINTMDSVYNDNVASKQKLYLSNDALNYAFLYMMDPSVMVGFTFGHTKEEYGQKAKDHGTQLAINVRDETSNSDTLTAWLDTRYVYANDLTQGGFINLGLATVYDWLNTSYFDISDINLLLDAMDNAHLKNSGMSDKIPYLNNAATGMMHNSYYVVLALYGDVEDAELSSRFDEIEIHNLKAIRDMGNVVFENSSNWGEGLQIYAFESLAHIIPLYGGFSSALNENLFQSTSFLREFPEFAFYNVLPTRIDGSYHWHQIDDDDPDDNTRSVPTRKTFYALAGMLNTFNPDSAGLIKWLVNDSGWSLQDSQDVRSEYLFHN